MASEIGGINLVNGVLDSQYRIAVLERIVELMVRRSPGTIQQAEVERIRDEIFADLQKRFPEAGIRRS